MPSCAAATSSVPLSPAMRASSASRSSCLRGTCAFQCLNKLQASAVVCTIGTSGLVSYMETCGNCLYIPVVQSISTARRIFPHALRNIPRYVRAPLIKYAATTNTTWVARRMSQVKRQSSMRTTHLAVVSIALQNLVRKAVPASKCLAANLLPVLL